jgi:hypothetical protein
MSEILKTAAALFLLGDVDAEDVIHNLELLATQLSTIIHRRSFVNGPASKVGPFIFNLYVSLNVFNLSSFTPSLTPFSLHSHSDSHR